MNPTLPTPKSKLTPPPTLSNVARRVVETMSPQRSHQGANAQQPPEEIILIKHHLAVNGLKPLLISRLDHQDAIARLNLLKLIKASIDTLQYLPKARIFDLFNTKYTRTVIIGVGLMVFQQFGGINGIDFYASETFVAAGFSSGKFGTIDYAIIQVLPVQFADLIADLNKSLAMFLVRSLDFVLQGVAVCVRYVWGKGVFRPLALEDRSESFRPVSTGVSVPCPDMVHCNCFDYYNLLPGLRDLPGLPLKPKVPKYTFPFSRLEPSRQSQSLSINRALSLHPSHFSLHLQNPHLFFLSKSEDFKGFDQRIEAIEMKISSGN
ncbi:unnamed protein product [Fraxinus pennsylvanica]|uniref:Uncharacterized protein n=1 Tax=Fraxinus pennsylvanica TaxID=56036 RepID=A0AAD1ZT64_9LAMI|nr:unnamed protein product [Fraxinus pennsylvanica]